jgi:hypothetical protein
MKAPPLLGEIPVIGVGGFVAALYLTWRLLRAIQKSGDLTLKK